jgi:hypothetical protein
VLLKTEEFLHSVIVMIEMTITATASVNVRAKSCKNSAASIAKAIASFVFYFLS